MNKANSSVTKIVGVLRCERVTGAPPHLGLPMTLTDPSAAGQTQRFIALKVAYL